MSDVATAGPADAAQPGQPEQGAQGQGADGLYSKYLQDTPEDLRPFLTDALSRYSREAVEPKFREAADFRKQWEPFAEMGFNEVDPGELAQAYNLFQVFNDPSIAQEVLAEPDAFQAAWEKVGESLGFFGDEDEEEAPQEGQPDFLAQVRELLDERLSPLEQSLTERQRNESVDQAKQQITQELDALQEEHGEFNREIVIAIAATKYGEAEDAIQRAFKDYQSDRGGAQAALLEQKVNGQPGGALSGGQPSSEPQRLSFQDDSAKQAALSRLRGGTT
jgi:hypothetical protein